jgi:hypothetical protein
MREKPGAFDFALALAENHDLQRLFQNLLGKPLMRVKLEVTRRGPRIRL